jgi:hypothetical protein
MNAKLEIINTMTEPAAWLERVHEQMGQGNEILLLLAQLDQGKSNALAKLCHAYHYWQDCEVVLPEQYRQLLDVHDYAAKEHGIGAEMVFRLHPQGNQLTEPRLV